MSINEFLKPAEGERYYGGRGRGRGRGDRGGFRGGYGEGHRSAAPPAPEIKDQSQFPHSWSEVKCMYCLQYQVMFAVNFEFCLSVNHCASADLIKQIMVSIWSRVPDMSVNLYIGVACYVS